MKTFEVVYWTGSGNTQVIADAVFEALEDAGWTGELRTVSEVEADDVKDAEMLFLGCPSMSGEDVEEYEFRPFLDDLKPLVDGKPVVLFGSYDWGDGEWMDSWVEEMSSVGAKVVLTLIYQWEPTDEQVVETYEKVTALTQE